MHILATNPIGERRLIMAVELMTLDFCLMILDYSSKYQQFIKQNEHETYRNRSCFESFISHLWIIAAIILILLGRFLSTLD